MPLDQGQDGNSSPVIDEDSEGGQKNNQAKQSSPGESPKISAPPNRGRRIRMQLKALISLIANPIGTLDAAVLRKRNETLAAQAEILRRQRASQVESVDAAVLRKRNETLAAHVETLRRQRARQAERVDALSQRTTILRERIDALGGPQVRKDLELASAYAKFVLGIAHGKSVAESAVSVTRELMRGKDRFVIRAFAHRLSTDPAAAAAGILCTAIHAHADGFYDFTRSLLVQIEQDACLDFAPKEYVDSWLREDDAAAVRFIRSLAGARFGRLPPANWFAIAKALAAHRHLSTAWVILRSLEEVRQADQLNLTPEDTTSYRWMYAQLKACIAATEPDAEEPGVATIGITGYKMLDYHRTSSNIGDYVQTLAFLSNLARFKNIDFGGASELGDFINGLRDRVALDRRLTHVTGRACVQEVDRDFASGRRYRTPTWMVTFGWFMHPNFKQYFDFPFPESIRPIFISMHVNNRNLLTEEAVAYLKKYGPVGCRDWTTVYLMREHGVKAFFSGCITSTVGQIFQPADHAQKTAELALIDYKPKPDEFGGIETVSFTQAATTVRETGMVHNLKKAADLLEQYRTFKQIATSRLHCYLPCRSLGLEVIFNPRNRADVRFEGLIDLDTDGLARMRHGIESKIAAVLEAILSGNSEGHVYALWREICAQAVAEADAYCRSYPSLPPPSFDLQDAVQTLQRDARIVRPEIGQRPDAIEVAFALDQNLANELPVVIESAIANSSRPLSLNVLSRGLSSEYFDGLARAFPEVGFRFFPCDDVDYGQKLRMLVHTTVSTMDRLLLPDLLQTIKRIIYLDIDILVLGDLAELWDLDLAGMPLAGKSSTFPGWKHGYNMVYRAAVNLSAEDAWQLRRRMHDEGGLGFPAFNAGVLLMDLERMREDEFGRNHIPLIENFGMNDQDVLNVYARQNRRALGLEWNTVPSQDRIADPQIVHWAGPVKPWADLYILLKEQFQAYRKAYQKRQGRLAKDIT